MADFKSEKGGSPMIKTWGFFVAQFMVLSHRAKFHFIINFFWVKAVSTRQNKSLTIAINSSTIVVMYIRVLQLPRSLWIFF